MIDMILKIAKGLENFSLDEIEMIAEVDNIQEYLDALVDKKKIIKVSGDRYKIIRERKKYSKHKKVARQIVFRTLSNRYVEQLTCKSKTIYAYSKLLERHILPVIGDIRILKIDKSCIERIICIARNNDLSDKTIWNILTLISAVLDYGVKKDYLDINPVLKIQKPKIKSKNNYLSEKQVLRLMNKADLQMQAIIMVAINTGLQRSEIFDLVWDDIDFKNKKIIYKGRNLKILDDEIFDILKLQKGKTSSILVFPSQSGTQINGDNFSKRYFKKLAIKVQMPKLRFLDFRHTYRQNLIKMNKFYS